MNGGISAHGVEPWAWEERESLRSRKGTGDE